MCLGSQTQTHVSFLSKISSSSSSSKSQEIEGVVDPKGKGFDILMFCLVSLFLFLDMSPKSLQLISRFNGFVGSNFLSLMDWWV